MTKVSQNALFVGVDIAKATLEVALSDQRATETFANDNAGIAALLKRLKPLNVTLVLMEATGGFERQLAYSLHLAGFDVIVANPRHAHYFVLGLGHLAKTDRIDAKALARFARTLYESEDFEQRLLRLPSAEQQALDALVTRRTQLVQMRTATLRRRWQRKASKSSSSYWISRLRRLIATSTSDWISTSKTNEIYSRVSKG